MAVSINYKCYVHKRFWKLLISWKALPVGKHVQLRLALSQKEILQAVGNRLTWSTAAWNELDKKQRCDCYRSLSVDVMVSFRDYSHVLRTVVFSIESCASGWGSKTSYATCQMFLEQWNGFAWYFFSCVYPEILLKFLILLRWMIHRKMKSTFEIWSHKYYHFGFKVVLNLMKTSSSWEDVQWGCRFVLGAVLD